jgi:hypothetical protein
MLLLLLSSNHRGVFWDKKSRRWRCQLGHKNRKIFLGYFAVAEEAARAYDQKLVELHGGSGEEMSCFFITRMCHNERQLTGSCCSCMRWGLDLRVGF